MEYTEVVQASVPMTKNAYMKHHQGFCERMQLITKAKNHDYTGASEDPFANFRLVEQFGVLSTEEGFFTRMSDKMSRIASYIKKGELQVKDESVEDTLVDLANYCALLSGYLKSKKQG